MAGVAYSFEKRICFGQHTQNVFFGLFTWAALTIQLI